MERNGRGSIYRDRNAVQTKPTTSDLDDIMFATIKTFTTGLANQLLRHCCPGYVLGEVQKRVPQIHLH